MKLSILIPSLTSRKETKEKLLDSIFKQKESDNCNIAFTKINDYTHRFELCEDIEILVNIDEGQKSIGQKRNELMQDSTGEYICYIDDDDRISEDYLDKIFLAFKSSPDVVGFKGLYSEDGGKEKVFIHRQGITKYYEDENYFYRYPNHLNPVKRDIAIKFPFKDIDFSEDTDYATRLFKSGLIKTSQYIDSVLYYYDYISNKQTK